MKASNTIPQGPKATKVPKEPDMTLEYSPKKWQTLLSTGIIGTCILLVIFTIRNLSHIDEELDLTLPRTVGQARKLASIISRYTDDHYHSVFVGYFALYILLQSLCIPGSIGLSILAGYLFPSIIALIMICLCSTIGATNVYIWVHTLNVKRLIIMLTSSLSTGKLDRFSHYVNTKVKDGSSDLFLCMFILRATPIFPNWSINLFSPLINIPLKPFVLGTFTGILPLSVIHVWTGRMLNDLSNDQSLFNWQSVCMTSLMVVAGVCLIKVNRIR